MQRTTQVATRVPLPKGIARKASRDFNPADFLHTAGLGKVIVEVSKGEHLFSQGDAADSVFYMQTGRVKVSVVSKQGKEAVIALLGPDEFVGEECIALGHPTRLTTATALTDARLLKISRKEMLTVLRQQPALSDVFVAFLLTRNAGIQADLVDQLFNSSEKRLARVLLLLAHFGKEGKPEAVVPNLTQETLAEMVGTTRSRISFFLNRFRKMGFIKYNGEIQVHSSLLNVILHD
jgi:CRP/FNR family cyclic AMP-dependent transcriptional regulator